MLTRTDQQQQLPIISIKINYRTDGVLYTYFFFTSSF